MLGSRALGNVAAKNASWTVAISLGAAGTVSRLSAWCTCSRSGSNGTRSGSNGRPLYCASRLLQGVRRLCALRLDESVLPVLLGVLEVSAQSAGKLPVAGEDSLGHGNPQTADAPLQNLGRPATDATITCPSYSSKFQFFLR